MTIEIGFQYEETKARLEEKIREGEINARETISKGDAWCYLCLGRIYGRTIILKEAGLIDGEFFEQSYFVHRGCYMMEKNPQMFN